MNIRLATGTLAALITATLGAAGCKKAAPTCANRYRDLTADQRKGDFTCACEKGAGRGPVWGDKIYTTDSSICSAASHAGALELGAGGTVTVKPAAGCSNYTGSAVNGVTSDSWGAFEGSFFFAGKGDGTCATAAATAPTPTPAPAPAAPPAAPTAAACPSTWDLVPNASTATDLACSCAAVPTNGAVWGVGTYTSDSSICRAAVHAGAVPTTGGDVKIKKSAGCPAYKGSDANGIHTDSWSNHGGSFYFVGKGDGSC